MKKIKLLIILILIPIGLFIDTSFAKASNCNLTFLKTDKAIYYINENIKINASWDLDYNSDIEYAYVQIQIFNNFDNFLWNSSKYDEIGTFEDNWTIIIENLNLDFTNYSNLIFIKFYYYYYQEEIGIPQGEFLETIEITINKREASCELIGFRDHMRLGENHSFNVRFFDSSSDNSSNIINQEILFKIISNNSLLSQRNFTTNQTGMFEIFISSISHLRLGQNILIFEILNSKIYNNTEFMYEILLEKNLMFIDVIEFKEILNSKENLVIKLFFYYFSNNTIEPLNNTNIIMEIYCNNNLTFMNEYKTDKIGILSINVTQESFNSEEKSEDLIIKIIFNGNDFLENKSISLNLKINSSVNSNRGFYSQLSIYSLSVILIIITIIISLIFKNIKKNRENILTEITFRY
ncbi:MAG: hypothetical protein ACFE8L_03850 [Candidatus Hodarchaeota archaeon]